MKKRPGNAQLHKPPPNVCTASSQVPRTSAASGAHPKEVAQGAPSSAAATQGPFRNEQSSTAAPGPCLGSSAGQPDQRDAARQSRPFLSQAAGDPSASESLPRPAAGQSRASAAGRIPLQAWVPRKRNLASFDALDELSTLTSQTQHPAGLCLPALAQSGPNQHPSAGLPFRAPACLPGSQEATPQEALLPGSVTVAPAGLHEDLEGAPEPHARHAGEDSIKPCSSAPGTNLAAPSQLARGAGAIALNRRLHSKPFAAPRPIRKPEAWADASERPVGSSMASTACAGDTGPLLKEGHAAVHHSSQLQPSIGVDGSHARSRQSGEALDTDSLISDSEASKMSSEALERQPSGDGLADVAFMDGPSSTRPLSMPSHTANTSREPQLRALLGRRDAVGQGRADRRVAQPWSAADGASLGVVESPPARTAAANATSRHGKRAQPAGRRRLKRLYTGSDDAELPSLMAGPAQVLEVRA